MELELITSAETWGRLLKTLVSLQCYFQLVSRTFNIPLRLVSSGKRLGEVMEVFRFKSQCGQK